jgi:hypothetical protein
MRSLMSDFQWAMCQAGVITREEYQQQKEQEEREVARTSHKVAGSETLDFFCSAQSFMDWVKRELKKTPTPRQVKECIDKIRQVSLDRCQYTRISTFLKRIHTGLAGRPLNQRPEYLDNVWPQSW